MSEGHRKRRIQTERQADKLRFLIKRLTYRQTDRQAGSQRQTDRQIGMGKRVREGEIEKERERERDR